MRTGAAFTREPTDLSPIAASFGVVQVEVFLNGRPGKIPRIARLCENYVHGSTALTTNAMAPLEFKCLPVRPELSRRAPRSF